MRSGRGRGVVLPSRTTAGETTRLWKRKKPNSPAGNFPPESRFLPPPPSSHATGLGPAHRARGARSSGGGARVVLVRVRQHFHSLRSVGLGVFPLKSRRRLGEVQRSSPPLHPVAYSLSDIRSAKKVSGDPPPRVGGEAVVLYLSSKLKTNSKDLGKL